MNNYEVECLIGKGSYGKCYKAHSLRDDDVAVIKKVAFDGAAQSEAEASLREARVLSLLRHPHVVPYKEFFKHTDGDLCLVMAWCDGGDLFQHIRSLRQAGKYVDEAQAWQWLVQLLLALQYVHSKKILHRDVKTQNIFLSQGKALLGDFGLAKQLQRTFEMARTPIGTPYYMAPEVYEEAPYSFKSDIWALGCVMYEMLTGKPAFAAENLSRVVLRVIRGNYDPMPEHFSQTLRDVVAAMLTKAARHRPDANELLTHPAIVQHVQAYLDQLGKEGPNGWSTWRMKLPASMLAQMATVLEQASIASGAPSPRTPPKSDGVDEPGTPAGGAQQQQAQGRLKGQGDGQLLKRVEDLMSTNELIQGFSLQSLLDDPAAAAAVVAQAPDAGGKAAPTAGAPAAAAGAAHHIPGPEDSHRVVKLPPINRPVDKLPPIGKLPLPRPCGMSTPFTEKSQQGPYAELHVLQQQVVIIQANVSSRPQSQQVPAQQQPQPQPQQTTAVADEEEMWGGSDDEDYGELPFGQSIRQAPRTPAEGAPRPAQCDEDLLAGMLPQGSFGNKAPLQPAALAALRTPPKGNNGSFVFDDVSKQAGGAPRMPITPSVKAPRRADDYIDVDDGFVSLGQVSLQETLMQRVGRLREYVAGVVGGGVLDELVAAVREAQSGQTGASLSAEMDEALHARMRGVLSREQMLELVPIVDEVVFLEGRRALQPAHC